MAWNGSLTAGSAVGSKITFTPDTSAEGGYTVSAFTAPKKGIYRFQLYGSGGTNGSTDADYTGANGNATVLGGAGGYTDGYMLLEKNQTVYVGAGGTCSAAFVSGVNGSKLSEISQSQMLLVAGAGGAAGRACRRADYMRTAYRGGNGGGTSGAAGQSGGEGILSQDYTGGGGGTQSAGGQPVSFRDATSGIAGTAGAGGAGTRHSAQSYNYAWGGRGGDGYFGGASGQAVATHNSETQFLQSHAWGGGGGSGYVKTAIFSHLGKTYTSSTAQGSGKAANTKGDIVVTYYARALLPVFFDGVQLEKIFFNGVDTDSLTYNGTLVYIQKLMRRWRKCLNSMAGRSGCPVATRALSRSALTA